MERVERVMENGETGGAVARKTDMPIVEANSNKPARMVIEMSRGVASRGDTALGFNMRVIAWPHVESPEDAALGPGLKVAALMGNGGCSNENDTASAK